MRRMHRSRLQLIRVNLDSLLDRYSRRRGFVLGRRVRRSFVTIKFNRKNNTFE